MQKLVIDTNVLVSALIQNSYPYFIINSIPTSEDRQWCISDEVLNEYTQVLGRVKFHKYRDFASNAEMLLTEINKVAERYYPQIRLAVIDDISDNKFLELAATCNADFIITGNTNDFTMSSFGQTKIVTPKVYWESYR